MKIEDFNWNLYLTIAQNLTTLSKKEQQESIKEAELRCSMSRAYYAIHNRVRNFLVSKKKLEKKASHWDVIDKLREHKDDQDFLELGELLCTLKINRENADYDNIIYEKITEKNQTSLQSADDAMSILKKLS